MLRQDRTRADSRVLVSSSGYLVGDSELSQPPGKDRSIDC